MITSKIVDSLIITRGVPVFLWFDSWNEPEKATAIYKCFSNRPIPKRKFHKLLDRAAFRGVDTVRNPQLQHLMNLLCSGPTKDRINATAKFRNNFWLFSSWCLLLDNHEEFLSIAARGFPHQTQKAQHIVLPVRVRSWLSGLCRMWKSRINELGWSCYNNVAWTLLNAGSRRERKREQKKKERRMFHGAKEKEKISLVRMKEKQRERKVLSASKLQEMENPWSEKWT